jgi:hypothetical protein
MSSKYKLQNEQKPEIRFGQKPNFKLENHPAVQCRTLYSRYVIKVQLWQQILWNKCHIRCAYFSPSHLVSELFSSCLAQK